MTTKKRGYDAWIGVDLDGTLAKHEPGASVDHIGEPIPEMVERIKRWLAEGQKVKIMTARVCRMASVDDQCRQKAMIQNFCVRHFGRVLEVTHEKDYAMIELWDDRAVSVERNTGVVTTVGRE